MPARFFEPGLNGRGTCRLDSVSRFSDTQTPGTRRSAAIHATQPPAGSDTDVIFILPSERYAHAAPEARHDPRQPTHQVLRRLRRRPGRLLRRPGGPDRRLPRAQRRRQDHDHAHPGRLPHRHVAARPPSTASTSSGTPSRSAAASATCRRAARSTPRCASASTCTSAPASRASTARNAAQRIDYVARALLARRRRSASSSARCRRAIASASAWPTPCSPTRRC